MTYYRHLISMMEVKNYTVTAAVPDLFIILSMLMVTQEILPNIGKRVYESQDATTNMVASIFFFWGGGGLEIFKTSLILIFHHHIIHYRSLKQKGVNLNLV